PHCPLRPERVWHTEWPISRQARRGFRQTDDDIAFLENFRQLVDDYLVLGYAPSHGSPRSLAEQEEAHMARQLRGRYEELRRQIAERRPLAKQLLSDTNAQAVLVQYPPPAVGGPVIEVHLLDAITNNPMWQGIPRQQILDVIDHAIGAL